MWCLGQTPKYQSKFRSYSRKHEEETAQALSNLDTLLRSLNQGANPVTVHHGFIHREPQGVIAIDQSGMDGKGRQTRLYVYPDEKSKTLILVTLGDKGSQRFDLADCREFVTEYRKANDGQEIQ